jgi:hypothetical protein
VQAQCSAEYCAEFHGITEEAMIWPASVHELQHSVSHDTKTGSSLALYDCPTSSVDLLIVPTSRLPPTAASRCLRPAATVDAQKASQTPASLASLAHYQEMTMCAGDTPCAVRTCSGSFSWPPCSTRPKSRQRENKVNTPTSCVSLQTWSSWSTLLPHRCSLIGSPGFTRRHNSNGQIYTGLHWHDWLFSSLFCTFTRTMLGCERFCKD